MDGSAEALSRLALLALRDADGEVVDAEAARLLDALASDDPARALAREIVETARARRAAEAELRDGQARLAEAQRIGRMGSYDWDIETDTNRWSDELYRIYGEEPQSFNATYDRFLGFVHPDDRASIIETHQQALQTGEPFTMEERIVRHDGEERLLESWGEVVMDAAGRPTRLRGICRDVTEQRRAEQAAKIAGDRLAAVVEAAPDAVVIVDGRGTIVGTNAQVEDMLGYSPTELVGQPVEVLLPEALRARHRVDRTAFLSEPHSRAMGVGLELAARRKDGIELAVDVALGPVSTADGLLVAAFVRDVTERKQAEAMAARLHEADTRRRQALELNDNVVQGMVAASYAADLGQWERATVALRSTLEAARSMMENLLDLGESPAPGSLVRAAPAPSPKGLELLAPVPPARAGIGAARAGRDPKVATRVLVVDDSPDIRLLVRRSVESLAGVEVVGEAADGASAVAEAARLQPDLVLLDLAMPGMDGLEALPGIKAAVPGCDVIALSGFAAGHVQAAALKAGASGYVEKGSTMTQLVDWVRRLRPGVGGDDGAPGEPRGFAGAAGVKAGAPAGGAAPAGATSGGSGSGGVVPARLAAAGRAADRVSDAIAQLVHELRTPLTVVSGVARTLADRRDQLPSSAVQELLETITRNGDQMAALLDAVAAARDAMEGQLVVAPEEVDLAELCRTVLADLAPVLGDHPVTVAIEPDRVLVAADTVRVRQILTNLLTNVARFTPPGTPLAVGIEIVEGAAELSVRDWGPGIPDGQADRLFGRYATLDETSPGMGLGLYLSRELARAHGGDLVRDAAVREGTRFVLRLPGAHPVAGA